MTMDMVLYQLGILATSDIDYFEIDEKGNVSVKEGAPWHAMAAVKKIKRIRTTKDDGSEIITTEIELWDKNTALSNMLKHLSSPKGTDENPVVVEHRWKIGGREIVF